MSGAGLDSKHRQIRTGAQTGLRLCRLPVRPQEGQALTNTRMLAVPKLKDSQSALRTDLPGQTANVPNGTVNSYRKASPPKSAPYETDTMAFPILSNIERISVD